MSKFLSFFLFLLSLHFDFMSPFLSFIFYYYYLFLCVGFVISSLGTHGPPLFACLSTFPFPHVRHDTLFSIFFFPQQFCFHCSQIFCASRFSLSTSFIHLSRQPPSTYVHLSLLPPFSHHTFIYLYFSPALNLPLHHSFPPPPIPSSFRLIIIYSAHPPTSLTLFSPTRFSLPA